MTLDSLMLFVMVVWIMVLVVCAFLIAFVAPIHFVFRGDPYDRAIISLVQVSIAILAVIVFAYALSKLKKAYLQRHLK